MTWKCHRSRPAGVWWSTQESRHDEGLDEAKVREVPCWRESEVFSLLEREVLAYAEVMSTTPLTVTEEMTAGLVRQLGAPPWSR